MSDPQSPMTGYRIEPMQLPHLEQGLGLSRLAGWNQRYPDWELLYRLHPQGAFVAMDESAVIGTVTTADYNTAVGWIAMVLVHPQYRGKRIATQLMQRALQALTHVNSIQLDATPAGRNVYSKIGFRDLFGLKRMTASSGNALGLASPPPRGVRKMRGDDLPAAIALDRQVSGVDRSVLLSGLLTIAPDYAWVYSTRSTIEGFIFGRHGCRYESVGPLVAADETMARALLASLLYEVGSRAVAIDCPDFAAQWQQRLMDAGMTCERTFIRMAYKQQRPFPSKAQSLYAIAGPELG